MKGDCNLISVSRETEIAEDSDGDGFKNGDTVTKEWIGR